MIEMCFLVGSPESGPIISGNSVSAITCAKQLLLACILLSTSLSISHRWWRQRLTSTTCFKGVTSSESDVIGCLWFLQGCWRATRFERFLNVDLSTVFLQFATSKQDLKSFYCVYLVNTPTLHLTRIRCNLELQKRVYCYTDTKIIFSTLS